jgi:hypothetical protein
MPSLTVVVGTTQPWPEVRATLDSLFDQVTATGGEVIVADGSGQELPADGVKRYPGLVWLQGPQASPYALRGLALARAQGDLIAVTEDHCTASPDWCANVLRVHAEHPDARVLLGAVANGCPERLMDWAHHFLVFGPAVPPLDAPGRLPTPGAANVIYDRRVIPREIPAQGLVEMFFLRELQARGERVIADASILMTHSQSFPFLVFCRYHFHNGRTIAGVRLARLSRFARVVRLCSCGVLPLYVAGVRFGQIWRKRPLRRKLVTSVPWLAALCVAHACGEFVGYLTGAGSSPARLR